MDSNLSVFKSPSSKAKPEKKTHKRCNFTQEEDTYLRFLVSKYGENSWALISSFMPHRNVRQCRERWFKYLSPTVKNNEWTEQEDMLLVQKRKELGPKWKEISKFFDGRTDINIKSRFNVLKRKVMRRESLLNSQVFPVQQKPITPNPEPVSIKCQNENVQFINEFDNYSDLFADTYDWFDPISLQF